MQTTDLLKLVDEDALKSARLFQYWQTRPVDYIKNVLGVTLWDKQIEICNALIEHKRVMVRAGNGPGKSFLAAALINWYFDCLNPSRCLSTGPSMAQMTDTVWSYVRVLRRGRPGLQPKAPRMEDAPDHYAAGYTSSSGDSFQGRHAGHLFLIFDEATGIEQEFWKSAWGMQPEYWLVMLNPTDTTSKAFEEEQSGKWHVISVSSFDHPNISEGMKGLPPPYPDASLTMEWLRESFNDLCDPVAEGDRKATDIEFEGIVYRPGPEFEARVLGMWPTLGSSSIWSEAMWNACLLPQDIDESREVTIGCDVARKGKNFTSMIVRRGASVLHHETHNGYSVVQTAGRLKQLCVMFAGGGDPKNVLVCIDDTGVGGGVVDCKDGYRFLGITASNKSITGKYRNKRSECWFLTAKQAVDGGIDVSRLSKGSLALLRSQLMSPTWTINAAGQREVERKEDTDKRIGRSPDDADALNLAFAIPRRTIKVLDWN